MCDTLWKKTADGIIFGKNSDRACNEPNLTVFIKGGKRNEENVKCTYITIPQVKSIYSVLLVKPSWMWGAEMGINEKGVTIGNEAVFTKSKNKKTERLLGMDMLRLALERCADAIKAKDFIIQLLTTYGQGGNCGYDKEFYYDNSFLITDAKNAYVIETSGKDYVVKELNESGNISNRLSIDENFYNKNSEPIYTYFSGSKQRLLSGKENCEKVETVKDMMQALRAHDGESDSVLFKKGSVRSVCMHQSLLGDHTTGSMVVKYGKNISIYITGSSTPCISAFKPVIFGKAIPPVFYEENDSLEYWKKREYLNRAIFSGYINVEIHRDRIKKLEDEFIEGYERLLKENNPINELEEFVKKCAQKEEELISTYDSIINGVISGDKKLIGQWKKRTGVL